MTRTLRPCGTQAAYKRHLRNHEPPCDECRHGETERKRGFGPAEEQTQFDLDLAEHPPQIIWRKNSHGVREAIYVDDPHAEREPKDRRPKGLRDIDIEYLGEIS
jgi:hypothetical protein